MSTIGGQSATPHFESFHVPATAPVQKSNVDAYGEVTTPKPPGSSSVSPHSENEAVNQDQNEYKRFWSQSQGVNTLSHPTKSSHVTTPQEARINKLQSIFPNVNPRHVVEMKLSFHNDISPSPSLENHQIKPQDPTEKNQKIHSIFLTLKDSDGNTFHETTVLDNNSGTQGNYKTMSVGTIQETNDIVAVTILKPEHTNPLNIDREVSGLTLINDIAGCCGATRIASCEGQLVIMQPYCEGGTFKDAIKSNTMTDQVFYLANLAHTLADLHSHKIIHNDIKDDNVMFKFDPSSPTQWSTRLIDFGQTERVRDGEVINNTGGTVRTFSPEKAVVSLKIIEYQNIERGIEELNEALDNDPDNPELNEQLNGLLNERDKVYEQYSKYVLDIREPNDVWTFGLLCYQTTHGERLEWQQNVELNQANDVPSEEILYQAFQEMRQPIADLDPNNPMDMLIKDALTQNPKNRPTMEELNTRLQEMLNPLN
ncbi:MAG: protein kinase [Parachlamydiales bacterium]|jgi:serine/threonine protein kinase